MQGSWQLPVLRIKTGFQVKASDTICRAGTIAVLVDGHIAEVGTREELERNALEHWSLFLA
jgi:hypothetical protein